MNHDYLTVHILTAVPHHARNRDDRGAPKSHMEGGVLRGILSSWSLKRAARVKYERAAAGNVISFRSRALGEHILDRAAQIAEQANIPFDRDAASRIVKPLILDLTVNIERADKAALVKARKARAHHEAKAPADASPEELAEFMAIYDAKVAAKLDAQIDKAERDAETAVWLSAEEVEAIAQGVVADGSTDNVFSARSSSLAIAGFGRMLAHRPEWSSEAAIAVSPATTTHSIAVEFDLFTTVDDLIPRGISHLNQSAHTTGVYYRTVTFDRKQLQRSWTGITADAADEQLTSFVRTLIETLPQAGKNNSAAEPLPAVVIAETQLSRTGYEFDKPVQLGADGGYLAPSMEHLYQQARAARLYDPEFFGDTLISGVNAVGHDTGIPGADVVGIRGMVSFIVGWVKAAA
ncbi:type I-E CRISPR-associated protein Cas7/Cse4/CasC [Leifsonia sp. Leaf264]|uniref:type I-E CRISPR-associated protein Cas7/Cse4/CasC n=1 Tax=Leifsonia sp. Leaf264 TaxID=1736314 RepID=UPI0007010216|nr:type I-E CRISPR-associated protein Cas7/Cse4/CasC [Leifsonia sp. Leaf264]KQO98762.1 hypothetical protein ASF30_11920 [Leifsonia sp. Leaf264]